MNSPLPPDPTRAPLATSLGEHGLWLSPAAAGLVLQLLDRYARLEGITLAPHTKAGTIRSAAADVVNHARRGHADVRETPASPASTLAEIGSAEAAVVLGCTERHVRRLADDGQLGRARKVKGKLRISATAVQAYASTRRAE